MAQGRRSKNAPPPRSTFIDLCRLVGHPTPAEDDPTGQTFTFEAGATKPRGGQGWADVWKKGYFAWEYKGKHKDLDAAYQQLLQYRESLHNPPLLVVSRHGPDRRPHQLYQHRQAESCASTWTIC